MDATATVSRVTWTHDAADQMTAEHSTGGASYRVTHVYDAAGNRTRKQAGAMPTTFVYDAANQLVTDGSTTYVYDAAGNLNVEGSTTYTWDGENRMRRQQAYSGLLTLTHTYDPDGLRIERELDDFGTPGVKRFVYDGQNVLQETGSDDAVDVQYTHEPLAYGYLLSQRLATVDTYFHGDALGSTRFVTLQSGAVQLTERCQAYGQNIAGLGAYPHNFRWVGAYGYYNDGADTLVGANALPIYVRARFYDPDNARWISRDPIGFDDGDPNPFRYVEGIPVDATDPSGLFVLRAHCGPCSRGATAIGIILIYPLGPKCTKTATAALFRTICGQCCASVLTCWGSSGLGLTRCLIGSFAIDSFNLLDCLSGSYPFP